MIFSNARQPGENFKAYRARLRTVAKAVRLHLKGQIRHTSSEVVSLPLLGVDAQVDRAVLDGKFRDAAVVVSPAPRLPWPHGPRVLAGQAPKELRLARTRGVSYTTTPYIDGTKRCQRALLREFLRLAA